MAVKAFPATIPADMNETDLEVKADFAAVEGDTANSVGRDGAKVLGAGSCAFERDQVAENGPDIPQADESEHGREHEDHEVGPRWGQVGLRAITRSTMPIWL